MVDEIPGWGPLHIELDERTFEAWRLPLKEPEPSAFDRGEK